MQRDKGKEIDFCSECDCGKKRLIVNKHYYLCEIKNKQRLQSQKQHKIKQNNKVNINNNKKQNSLKKAAQIALYKEIERTRDNICESCGTTQNLTHSHIIPKSIRSDLGLEITNIIYQCINCHTIWEHGSWEQKMKLSNFNKMMNYIKETDLKYYNLLVYKNNLQL